MQEKQINVDELIHLFKEYKKMGKITGKTKIIIAEDEEGNSYSPLMVFKSGMHNFSASLEYFVLYPSSMHRLDSIE